MTIGLPYAWKRSDLTLHFLLKGYILSYLDALEGRKLWEQINYCVFFPHTYILESASLCPLSSHQCSSQSCHCLVRLSLIWRIEVVEAKVEDSVSLFQQGADRGCHLYLSSLLIDIFISHLLYLCNYEYSYPWMYFIWLYILDWCIV